VKEVARVSHNLFGDLSALHGQFKNLTRTVQAQKALQVTYDWCNEYAQSNGWGVPKNNVIAAVARKGNGWQGAPLAEPTTRLDMSTSIAVNPEQGGYLEIADAILWRAKMTGMGFAKHPTWVGETLLVAALLDSRARGIASFSAICQSILPSLQNALMSAFGKPGVFLGKTKEVRTGDEFPLEDFRLYSAAPNRLDRKVNERLTAALDGWTGHIRVQAFPSFGLFLAWDWRGDDRARWSADADKVVSILQQVRDAFLGLPPGISAKAASKTPSPSRAQPKPPRPSSSPKPSSALDQNRSTKAADTQAAQKNSARSPGSRRRTGASRTDSTEKVALRYSVSYQQQYFRLPPGMSAGVQKWLVRPGADVTKGQPIVLVTLAGDDGCQQEALLTAPVDGCHITRRRRVGTQLTGRSIVAHVSGTPSGAGK
jgi:hypothetical protein